ncbi:hypothetical protein CBS101457_006759 [Exobasidium rhododendri]|nr:hypothetical protein CBS101457_006759 [Exobasidium rhododendri]
MPSGGRSSNGINRAGESSTDVEEEEEESYELDDLKGGYTPYLGRLTAVACLGGLQFGWDTGVAAGMLVAIHQDLGHTLSASEQEIIVSSTTVGAIVGALLAGRLSERLGRKKVMIIAGVFFTLGSFEQAASQVIRELVLGRVLVGLGVGMASMIVPTYLAECAPTSIRGRIIAINSLLITGGQVIAYVVNAAFYSLPHGWRWMVLAGGVPAIIQLIGLFYLDESPRWLISRGRHTSARHVLARIYPHASQDTITRQVRKIEKSLQMETSPSQSSLSGAEAGDRDVGKGKNLKTQLSSLWNDGRNRKALFLACGLQASQQLVGANSILYFSSRLLFMAGFKANPNSAAIAIAVANLIGTAIALRLVDRIGRRKLLLQATAAATIALIGLSIALSQIPTGEVTDSQAMKTDDGAILEHPPAGALAYVSLVAMVFFLFFYALGLGIVPWLVQSEIFSGDVRGVGGGLATATNWTCNLIISATYLDLVRVVTPAGSFGIFAGVGALTWIFAYYQLPELSGVSLNDVQSAFGGEGNSGQGAAEYFAVSGQDDEEEADEWEAR